MYTHFYSNVYMCVHLFAVYIQSGLDAICIYKSDVYM